MHKKLQSLLVVGVLSANTLTPTFDVFANEKNSEDKRVEYSTNREGSDVVKASKDEVYLSDIEYEKGSTAGWGQIRKDTNIDGDGLIRLNVDGETKEFEKGMAAHATSTLIYNVSKYKDTYTRLVSYLGVDARKGSDGNGVIFTISTSKDGQNWTEVKKTGVLKGSNEADYIDINLKDVNYIKLYANDNGSNGYDHACYGDIKLVKDDYSLASVSIEGLKTLDEYDEILKNKSIDYNIANNELIILRRALVKRVGYESIQRIASKDSIYSDGIKYLMNNIRALRYFITGGPVNKNGSYQRSLKAFCEIHDKYKDILDDSSDDYFNLRLAISISLSFANPNLVRFWMLSEKDVSSVNRFEVYQALVKSGKMDEGGNTSDYGKWSTKQFKALPIPLMRWTVGNRINDDEVFWLADYALKEKAKHHDYFDAYNYIEYTMGYDYNKDKYYDMANYDKYNEKYGFGKYINDYGTRNVYRLWMIFEEGSVCGGLAKTYSNLANTFGRPSSVVGQPGHAATMTWGYSVANKRYEWMLQNDISGWAESGNEYDDRMLGWGNESWCRWQGASYGVLATDAVNDYNNYTKATMLNLLADSYTDISTKKQAYLKALGYQHINLDSIKGLIDCYNNDSSTTDSEYLDLAKKIISTYTYYPQAMMELLPLIVNNINDMSYIAQIDVLKNNALLKATNATPEQSTCVQMTKQLANYYLENNQSDELATFSFDGENAGKIVLNPKYDGSQIRVEYSLDGGNTWKETDKHTIKLTKEELDSITAENDIKLKLANSSAVHTIDILPGNTISTSSIVANDEENLLVGDIANLEFSLDGGNTWCDYVSKDDEENINPNNITGIRIKGNKKVKVRYKAHGHYLQSNEASYTFTENTDTKERRYIPLKNVKLEAYTSQQSTSREHAATNFIDGNPNTAWHTAYRQEDNKFYTVSFDKLRNISSLEYLPGNGANGRLRSGQILTSVDGENWNVSATFTDIGNNRDLKQLPLDNPTKCKYVKLVATETYGNSTGEENKYFSGKDIAFYESVEEPEIPDNDFDSDMNVDSEKIPSAPNHDVEDSMKVNSPSAPNYDVEDDMGVNSSSNPNYDVEDNMEVVYDDVLELVDGDGEESTPYEFTVKEVELDRFNKLLNDLREWSINFIDISREDDFTLYKLKLDQKLRRSNSSVYITIRVKDEQTEVLSALDEFKEEVSKQTEMPEISIPSVGDATLVETETKEGESENEEVLDKEDKEDVSSDSDEGSEVLEDEKVLSSDEVYDDVVSLGNKDTVVKDVVDEENPKTGDVSVFRYVGGGFVSLVGIFGLNRRRKRK